MRRSLALLVFVAGCAGDPEMDPLAPGAKAVVTGEYDVALNRPGRSVLLDMLPPGTRVLVRHDAGYAVRTQADINRDIASPFRPHPHDFQRLLTEKPGKYPPPHWRARFRVVDVVVQSGIYRGHTGRVLRADLRPVR